MKYRVLPASNLKVSEVCLGTMTWGQQNSEAEGHAQLDYAVEQGINFIDTAEMYPVPPNATTQGRTETILGRWLARHGRRNELADREAGEEKPDRDGRSAEALGIKRQQRDDDPEADQVDENREEDDQ